MPPRLKIPEEKREKVIGLYGSGASISKVSSVLGCSYSAARNLLIREGKHRPNSREYSVNDSFFESMTDEMSCYWLGFIVADGCILTGRNSLKIQLSTRDINHLYLFKKDIQAESPVKSYEYKGRGYCRITVTSKQLVQRLSEFGVVPNKTSHEEWDPIEEVIDEEMMGHFIRGVFDGDGCWCVGTRGQVYFDLVSASINFVNGFRYYFARRGVKLYLRNQNNAFYLRTGNAASCYRIYKMMYGDCSRLLIRKKEKINLESYFFKRGCSASP